MKKPRRTVEPGLNDPLSQKITALQMKIVDLKVDFRRANKTLENLINIRGRALARQAIIDGAIQGINEAFAEDALVQLQESERINS